MSKHTHVPACYLVLMKDDKVLLIQRSESVRYYPGWYSLVAGHVEAGETFSDAMVREAREEAGLDLKKEDLEAVHIMQRCCPDSPDYVDVFFVARHWDGEPQNMEPDKCSDMQWFTLNELPEQTIPAIVKALGHIQKRDAFSELQEDPIL